MAIDDTIKRLTKIYQSIDRGIPKWIANPDDLVDHLNHLYIKYTEDLNLEEAFDYDDVGRPSITLTVSIDVDFDIIRVMENMQKRLRVKPQEKVDEIGGAGLVWSCGRYDFMYDDSSENLRISHRYSHKQINTQSVLSITKKMLSYAKDYLEEVRKSAEESTSTPETE